MSKRKADEPAADEPQEKRGPAAAAAAASSSANAVAAASPCCSSSASSLFAADSDATIAAVQHRMRESQLAARLSALLQNKSKRSSVDVMTSLVQLLDEDASRERSLINPSFKLADGGTLLTLLIESLVQHIVCDDNDSDAVRQEKRDAAAIIDAHLKHLLQLIRAADVSKPSKDDEPALSMLCRLVVPHAKHSWIYRVAEALLQAGADAEARNTTGETLLISWLWEAESACGPLLLLRHGANIDAQHSRDGSTMLHTLVKIARRHKEQMLPALRQLAESGYLALADFTLLNNAGQTALELAEEEVDDAPGDAPVELLETLQAQSTMWAELIRPAVFGLLSHGCLLPDLAEIVLAYVEGGKRPSEMQRAENPADMDVDAGAGAASSAAAAAASS